MSGPKTTRIRPGLSRAARQRLRHLLPELAGAASMCRDTRPRDRLEELTRLVGELRIQLAEFRVATTSRGETLDALSKARTMIDRCRVALDRSPRAEEVAAAITSIESALAGRGRADVDRLHSRAGEILGRATALQSASDQLEGAIQATRKALAASRPESNPSGGAHLANEAFDQGVRAMLEGAASAELSVAEKAPADAITLGGFDRAAHAALVESAQQLARAGDSDSAAGAIERARTLRLAAMHAGNETRERIVQREEIATRLAEALQGRNYDEVQAYFKAGGDGGEAAPLVLYAANPSNRANVRITLGIDGSMIVEIDGVENGEEEVCLEVLQTFRKTIEDAGDEFDLCDLGRANWLREAIARKKQRQPKERQG